MAVITYQLQLAGGDERRFEVNIDRPDLGMQHNMESHPSWTRLENHQCPLCPLDTGSHHYCPAAIEMAGIAHDFAETTSIERADVWVHTEERSYFKNCDMQSSLQSLFGLIMATGPCPILSRLKPMARSHLPFATLEETMQRLVGSYLVKQYVCHHDGSSAPDWELSGLQQLYRDLKVVNVHLMKRIRQASNEDASINAIQTFISISSIVDMVLEDIVGRMIPILRKGI